MPSKSWYYAHNGEKVGPIRSSELRQLANAGIITCDTRIWDSDGNAYAAGNVKGLFDRNTGESRAYGLSRAGRADDSTGANSSERTGSTSDTGNPAQLTAAQEDAAASPLIIRIQRDPWYLLGNTSLFDTSLFDNSTSSSEQIAANVAILLSGAIIIARTLRTFGGPFIYAAVLFLFFFGMRYLLVFVPFAYRRIVNFESRQVMHCDTSLEDKADSSSMKLCFVLRLRPEWKFVNQKVGGQKSQHQAVLVLYQDEHNSPFSMIDELSSAVYSEDSEITESNQDDTSRDLTLTISFQRRESTNGPKDTFLLSGHVKASVIHEEAAIPQDVYHYFDLRHEI